MLRKFFLLSLISAMLALTGCYTCCHKCHEKNTDYYERTETVGQKIDDGVITSKVKTKFLAEKNFPSSSIHVNTVNQVVHLNGTVHSVSISNKAKNLALSVHGVRKVINHLEVK
jgi:osmotically-inducible protein OsmY